MELCLQKESDRVSRDVCLGQMMDVVENRQGKDYSRGCEPLDVAFLLALICGMMSERTSLHLLHVAETLLPMVLQHD